MIEILKILFLISGIFLIIFIIMQPQKQQDILSSIVGGAEDLFSNQKARGFESIMQRLTWITGFIWLGLGFALMLVS